LVDSVEIKSFMAISCVVGRAESFGNLVVMQKRREKESVKVLWRKLLQALAVLSHVPELTDKFPANTTANSRV
jgi:hypothetical protein